MSQKPSVTIQAILLLFVVILFSGCGGDKLTGVPVEGVVNYNGSPLVGATIQFYAGEKSPRQSRTLDGGKYKITLEPGKYKVVVTKTDREDEGAPAAQVDPDEDPMKLMNKEFGQAKEGGAEGIDAPIQLIPAKYSEYKQTELEYTVPSGGATDANFDLTGTPLPTGSS